MNPRTPTSQGPSPLLSLAGFRRLTPSEYHKMADAGILMEGEPIELLEGYMVEKPVRNPPHEAALRRLGVRLPRLLPAGWFQQIQGAVELGDSEPEPDGAVLRGDETSYDQRLPAADDIGIVIEVSDSTLAFDRRDKGRIYARADIPVYWVLNVVDRQVEVYTDPAPTASPPAFATRTVFGVGQAVPVQLDGKVVASIPVADLLP